MRCLQKEIATYRHWSVSLWRDQDDVPHCRILTSWQNWMAAYLGYTLRMKTLFCGWPVMVHDTHTRRRRRTVCLLLLLIDLLFQDGSLMSIANQQRSGDAPGITVYYWACCIVQKAATAGNHSLHYRVLKKNMLPNCTVVYAVFWKKIYFVFLYIVLRKQLDDANSIISLLLA